MVVVQMLVSVGGGSYNAPGWMFTSSDSGKEELYGMWS